MSAWSDDARVHLAAGRTQGAGAAPSQQHSVRIMEAATAIARASGYDGVHMRDVAARAAVSPGTIYYHFPSKLHLLANALEWELDNFSDRVCVGLAAVQNPLDRLRIAVSRLVDFIEESDYIAEALIHAYAAAHVAAPGDAKAVGKQIRDMFLRVMCSTGGDKAINEFAADMVIDVLTAQILALAQGRRSYPEIHGRLQTVIDCVAANRDTVKVVPSSLTRSHGGMGLADTDVVRRGAASPRQNHDGSTPLAEGQLR